MLVVYPTTTPDTTVQDTKLQPLCIPPSGTTPGGYGTHDVREPPARPVEQARVLITPRNGNIFRVVIFLYFVSASTRKPRGAYAQVSGRNRIYPHCGEVERLARRTGRATPDPKYLARQPAAAQCSRTTTSLTRRRRVGRRPTSRERGAAARTPHELQVRCCRSHAPRVTHCGRRGMDAQCRHCSCTVLHIVA